MAADYSKSLMNDYHRLMTEFENSLKEGKKLRSEIKDLKKEVSDLKESNRKKDDKIDKLTLEIERIKNNNSKDSSNSSKPSSKNGFKKVPNGREKTGRKQGGQKGHKGHTSKESRVKELIDSQKAIHEVIDVNRNSSNSDKEYKVRYVQDVEIKTVIREYRYYPDNQGNYTIPKSQNNVVTYGSNIKSISMLLVHKVPASMDQATYFLNEVSNGAFNITKGTLNNWTISLSESLKPLIEEIKQELFNSYYVNTDESPINVNGKTNQLHNYSNEKCTLQYIRDKRNMKAIEDIGFLTEYLGTLIHDHNIVQYNYGIKHGECNAHILRYLQAVKDFTQHKWSEEMMDLLKDILHEKHVLQDDGVTEFEESTLKKYSSKYDEILNKANKEYQSDYDSNAYKDDERKLITRLGKYKENHLLFMRDFKIPFTNNRAETDIRPSKRKLNVGIFRSQEGAKYYLNIRSFISTFQKRGRDIFDGIKDSFNSIKLTLIKS